PLTTSSAPSPATPTECPRSRGPPTVPSSPPPTATGRCGSGTQTPATPHTPLPSPGSLEARLLGFVDHWGSSGCPFSWSFPPLRPCAGPQAVSSAVCLTPSRTGAGL